MASARYGGLGWGASCIGDCEIALPVNARVAARPFLIAGMVI
jgi:hypothetical protein